MENRLPWWLRWLKTCLQCRRPRFNPSVEKIPWRRSWQPTLVFLPGESPWTEEPGGLLSKQLQRVGFLASLAGKESACNAGDPSSIPGSGRSPGEGIGYSLQYSWASLVAQLVKNLPAMQETWVQSLGYEGPLVKGKATQNSMDYPWGCKESDTTERLHFFQLIPSPRAHPNPGIELGSPALQVDSLPAELPGKP